MKTLSRFRRFYRFFFIFIILLPLLSPLQAQETSLQVAHEVDVIVAGGSSAAVAAAVAAKQAGASVFLCTDRPYLGEDLCANLRYDPPRDLLAGSLVSRLFDAKGSTTPLRVKRALDDALISAAIPYLTGSYPSELLTDSEGTFSGITMVNRSGRQIVKGKVLIDATEYASLARQSKLSFRPFQAGEYAFQFRVCGGPLVQDDDLTSQTLDWTLTSDRKPHPVHDYRVSHHVEKDTWQVISRIEQVVRSTCISNRSLDHSERLEFHLRTQLDTPAALENWPGAAAIDLKHFGGEAIFILGKYAALSRDASAAMSETAEAIAVGERLGAKAAELAKKHQPAVGPSTNQNTRKLAKPQHGKVMESHKILRGRDHQIHDIHEKDLPVFGSYDVAVVGGGTSGAPAAIGSAERGASTLLIEYLDELGGVGTAGMINSYWYGYQDRNFTQRISRQLPRKGWNPVNKSDVLRQFLVDAGGDMWFRSFGSAAVVDDGKVVGVVVCTPMGRGVVLTKTVIDATGNSDVAASAGAETHYSIDEHGLLTVQFGGFPHRNLGNRTVNTYHVLVDDCDAIDIWHLMVNTRAKTNPSHYDVGQHLDSRARRQIVGDYTMTVQDVLLRKTYPDTICQYRALFDTHLGCTAFFSSPMFLVKDMKGPIFECNMPYRSFLPKGLSGIIAIGIGASTHSDVMTLTRMQPDLQNQGYTLGMAAAMAAEQDGDTRAINIKAFQRELLLKKYIDPKMAGGFKAFPAIRDEAIEAAVADVARLRQLSDPDDRNHPDVDAYHSLAILVEESERSLPLLKQAFDKTTDQNAKINYAKILSVLGDQSGKLFLLSEVNKANWDRGSTIRSYGKMDRLVIALGHCNGPQVEAALRTKIDQLKVNSPWSHYRAISIALQNNLHRDAVLPLFRLLTQRHFTGHDQSFSGVIRADIVERKNGHASLPSLREITIAGLLYRVGDHEDRGKRILQEYTREVGGQYARFAEHFLKAECLSSAEDSSRMKSELAAMAAHAEFVHQAADYTPSPDDILIADFEGENYAGWTASGEAFGTAPAKYGKTKNKTQKGMGSGYINTYLNGSDETTGRLRSPAFSIDRNRLKFLIGGGNHPERTAVRLIIDGEIVKTQSAFGEKDAQHREVLEWVAWDVSKYKGQSASLEIVDAVSDAWGHILVDHIVLTDE